jgi:hypothetical protein
MDLEFMKHRDQMKRVVSQEKPQYTFVPLRLVEPRRGNLRYSPARDLVFSPCVRGDSRLCLYENWISSPYHKTLCLFMALESYSKHIFQSPTLKLM